MDDVHPGLQLGDIRLEAGRCHVMGILNVTPDSFSDGGRFAVRDAALRHAEAMIDEGVDIIDVGGESTRPGAEPVSADEELARVMPVIEELCANHEIPVSVDTSKAEVMRAAVDAGAVMINDVRALREPGALDVAAASGVAVCLMHMLGEPRTMQNDPRYDDVVGEVLNFLQQRVEVCRAAGIDRTRIVIDPGFGFGKTLAQNLRLLASLDRFVATGLPVLAGISRKRMLGEILHGADVNHRLYASVSAAVISAQAGVAIVRVHDVAATLGALKVVEALREQEAVGDAQA